MDVPLMGMTDTWTVDDVPTDIENFLIEVLRRLVPESDQKLQDTHVFRNIFPVTPSNPQYNRDPQRRILTPEAKAAGYMTAETIAQGDRFCSPLNFFAIAPRQIYRNQPTAPKSVYDAVFNRLTQLVTPDDEILRDLEWTPVPANPFPFDSTSRNLRVARNPVVIETIPRPRTAKEGSCQLLGHLPFCIWFLPTLGWI